ncbi:hypothetical protein TELCIR_07658 [Teladorsagia circumcincta]|uniref:RRM domain-containing protein n=1 Tax=Teladorsagia circumcincta TaxID=45464 RepID=A0A2G9UJP6_TELCI|nr:hypothetical protein TELCIR_07658 [Teladorsagia circumcincta]
MGRDETRIYVGNLPPDCRERDIEDIFSKYGKIRFVDIKGGRGPLYAFIDFEDPRDAEDAVRGRDGYDFDGSRIRVEFTRGDHMREAGEVCYADVARDGTGVVEFIRFDDMKYAVRKLDDTKFRSHEGETAYIRVREDTTAGGGSIRDRSRSRSPRRSSPKYSPRRSVSRSRSRSLSRD